MSVTINQEEYFCILYALKQFFLNGVYTFAFRNLMIFSQFALHKDNSYVKIMFEFFL